MVPPRRVQIAGVETISEAIRSGSPLRLLLVRRDCESRRVAALVEEARARGTRIVYATANDMRRMSATVTENDLLGLVGGDPAMPPEIVLRDNGACWLLSGVSYAGNAGYAIRTAEVSGADAIFLDSPIAGRARVKAIRASMRASRFLPVHWEPTERIVGLARESGKRIIAIEDSGIRAPWEVDLTGSILFILGCEGTGIRHEVLAACDETVRLPMAGFVPSYNLHAAMAAVAVERLRQIETRAGDRR